jgi:hypothetical protein
MKDAQMAGEVEAYYLREHGDDPVLLTTAPDADRLVDQLLGQPVENSIAALYHRDRPLLPAGVPDHELYLCVDGDRRVGALMFLDATGNWVSQGDSREEREIRYYLMGNETEVPSDANVPLPLVRQATRDFLTSGGHRPQSIRWQPHDL